MCVCVRACTRVRACGKATRQTADFITTSLQCQPVRRSPIGSELRLVVRWCDWAELTLAVLSPTQCVLMPSWQSSNAIIAIY